ILTTQPRQLLTLIGRQAVRALALIPLGLLDPVTQRHIPDPKILRDLPPRLTRDANELDRLPTELLWIRRSGPRHFSPPRPVFRPKRSGVLETGGTPPGSGALARATALTRGCRGKVRGQAGAGR